MMKEYKPFKPEHRNLFCKMAASLTFSDFVGVAEVEDEFGIDNVTDYEQYLINQKPYDDYSTAEYIDWNIEDEDVARTSIENAHSFGMTDDQLQIIFDYFGYKMPTMNE